MQWIPSWLAKSYAMLYADKGNEWFDFEEAGKILQIEEKKPLSRRLIRLEEAGFLVAKRDAIDRRKKYFRVLNPNDVFFSYGIVAHLPTKDIMQRLTLAAKKIVFVIGGAYAAYVHSGYAVPGKIDIYVEKSDLDKCISLVSDMLAEKIKKTNFHVHSSLTEEMLKESVIIEDVRYESAESLVINGLREQSDFSLADSFSVLIKKRKDIDYNKMSNNEARKKIFNDKIIRRIHSEADFSRERIFPKHKAGNDDYPDIGRRWTLRITIPRAFVSKIITDLVR